MSSTRIRIGYIGGKAEHRVTIYGFEVYRTTASGSVLEQSGLEFGYDKELGEWVASVPDTEHNRKVIQELESIKMIHVLYDPLVARAVSGGGVKAAREELRRRGPLPQPLREPSPSSEASVVED